MRGAKLVQTELRQVILSMSTGLPPQVVREISTNVFTSFKSFKFSLIQLTNDILSMKARITSRFESLLSLVATPLILASTCDSCLFSNVTEMSLRLCILSYFFLIKSASLSSHIHIAASEHS